MATRKSKGLDERIKNLTAQKERRDKAAQLKKEISDRREALKKLHNKK